MLHLLLHVTKYTFNAVDKNITLFSMSLRKDIHQTSRHRDGTWILILIWFEFGFRLISYSLFIFSHFFFAAKIKIWWSSFFIYMYQNLWNCRVQNIIFTPIFKHLYICTVNVLKECPDLRSSKFLHW